MKTNVSLLIDKGHFALAQTNLSLELSTRGGEAKNRVLGEK